MVGYRQKIKETTSPQELNQIKAEFVEQFKALLRNCSTADLTSIHCFNRTTIEDATPTVDWHFNITHLLISNPMIGSDVKIECLNAIKLITNSDNYDFLYYRSGYKSHSNPDEMGANGWNPLHWAISLGDKQIVKYILTNAPQLNLEKDSSGKFPLKF